MATILHHLATAFGDGQVFGLELRPRFQKNWERAGAEPAFRLLRDRLMADFEELVYAEPKPALSIANGADTFVLFGSRGQWAIWTEPRWETTIIWAHTVRPIWRDAAPGVPFVGPSTVVDEFLGPAGRRNRVSRVERQRFLETFQGGSADE